MARYLVSVVSDPDAATPEAVAVQVDGDPDLDSVRPCGADLNLVRVLTSSQTCFPLGAKVTHTSPVTAGLGGGRMSA